MEQMKGSLVMESQQQQQQSTKKKSKNKKKNSRNETATAAATATTNVTSVSADESHQVVVVRSETAVNGLKDQLQQQLNISDSSSTNKVNGLVTEKQLNLTNCTNSTLPPAPSNSQGDENGGQESNIPNLNGHHKEVEDSTITSSNKKSKRKPNNKKNPPTATESLQQKENGHCLEEATNSSKSIQQEHLHNGFVPANKEDEHDNGKGCGSAQQSVATEDEKACNNTAMTQIPKSEQISSPQVEEKQDSSEEVKATTTSKQDVEAATGGETSSPTLDLSNVHIEYKEYESELQMHDIMRLIQAELSEPYSIYTYRYFIYNWPKLCFLAAHGNEYVGAIVCKLDMHMNVRRGYIAMLAVRKEYRKLKIGTTLVQKAIEAMLADKADEVVLETEMSNLPALRLYENLGFVRDKRLFRYYLNGVDALRLKLWFR